MLHDAKCILKQKTKYSYPDLHHLQGGMKYATQISPLLNFFSQTRNVIIFSVFTNFSKILYWGETVPQS